MNAKNLYARPKDTMSIKRDADFIQYITEMFTWNEDNENLTYPENVKLSGKYGRVEVFIFNYYSNSENEYTSIAYVYKCNICGEYSLILHDQPDYEKNCFGCKSEFSQVGDSKNIEW